MSMPPPRFLVIPAGAVIKYWNPPGNPDPPSLFIATTIADIQSFGFSLSEATTIYNSKIGFNPGPVSATPDKLIVDRGVSLVSPSVEIRSRKAGGATKRHVSPAELSHNTYYWLVPVKRKPRAVSGSKKPVAKKRR